jgi:CheY-like chemotaxis protein
MEQIDQFPKLNCVLLVDDDETTNFINKRIINRAGISEHVEIALNGREAIEALTGRDANGKQLPKDTLKPELIFLDLNMPVMNGWEFLDAYESLDEEEAPAVVVVMLTTALPDTMRQKAEKKRKVEVEFMEKPLTNDRLRAVLNHYFITSDG